uniref:Uncharacterized protein n=1 Tax=Arundo donax TaxID=35708 RepID=A0A0A9EDN8_ARUDO
MAAPPPPLRPLLPRLVALALALTVAAAARIPGSRTPISRNL